MSLVQRWQTALTDLREQGRLRQLAAAAGLDFSSNDYLGYSRRTLTPRPDLSASGAASRLLRGHHEIWEQVEEALTRWHASEAALIMTSGYTANEGLLATIIGPNDLVYSDERNHASIIDGLRLSKARKAIFRHNDLNHLEDLLRGTDASKAGPGRERFIVTESLFGMAGDTAPLVELAELAERQHAHLLVDEAHATGCFGLTGSGLVDQLGLRSRVLATVHTGGKALGVPGAYIACSRLLKEYLVNRCRHLIFTTALPPVVGAWWLETLQRVQDDEAGRRRLHGNARRFREALAQTAGQYIVPLTLGSDEAAVLAARRLQQAGYDIRAIRPPTVPEGQSCLRVSIHADHDEMVLSDLAVHLRETIHTV